MKKTISIIVFLAIISSILVSCKAEKTDEINASSETLTGAYIQQEVTPAQLNDGDIHQIRQLDDGRIVVIGSMNGQMPSAFVTTTGEAWEEYYPIENSSFFDEHSSHNYVCSIDDNGSWWIAAYNTEENDYHLVKYSKSEYHEIELNVFRETNISMVVDVMYGSDGTILVATMVGDRIEWTIIDCETGEEVQSFKQSTFYPVFTDYKYGVIYAVDGSNSALNTFDAKTGKHIESYNLPINASDFSPFVASIAKDNSINYVNIDGIRKNVIGGEITQIVTDKQSDVYASTVFGISKLCAASDGSYWLVGLERGMPKVFRYAFDQDSSTEISDSLHIWTMEDNSLTRLAVSVFAQKNPNCDVKVEYGRSPNDGIGAMSDEDIIRALNTRLLAGDVPDILFLDGLPIEQLIGIGILSDLSGLLNENEYYEGVLSSYTRNGTVYAYPAMFWPVIMAQAPASDGINIDDVNGLSKLEEMLLQTNSANFGGYYHLFETLYIMAAPDIFPGGNSVDEAALTSFLSMTKSIVDRQGIGQQEYCPIYGYDFIDTTTGIDLLPPDPSLSYFSVEDGTAPNYAISILYDYSTSVIWLRDRGQGTPHIAPLPGNTFLPKCIVSIPVGASNLESAQQFVQTLFECQTEEYLVNMPLTGFSTRKGLELELWRIYENEPRPEGVPAPPSADDLNLESVLVQLDTPSVNDTELHNKLYAQAQQLYMGSISLNDAVSAVLRDTELFFAERQ